MASASGAFPASQSSAAPASVREVFVEHGSFILRTLVRMGVGPVDAEDLAQEVFMVVQRKLADYQENGTMRAWLIAIMRRVVADHRRRAHVRRERATGTLPTVQVKDQQVDDVWRSQSRRILQEALNALDSEKRDVFVLYELERMPMREVADALKCPLQTAYSRLHSARKRMRALIEQRLGDDEAAK